VRGPRSAYVARRVCGEVDEGADDRVLVVGAPDQERPDLGSVGEGEGDDAGWARPLATEAGMVALAWPA
jgi:hypothetical protein